MLAIKLLNPAIDNRMMQCLITSLSFELFKNVIDVKFDGTLADHETIGDVAIALSKTLPSSHQTPI
ncbi:hypothetical protein NDI37_13180 [Funiculus sociatus GB2-A5]|uniref:Uncharacterized protein n=1 Tax=Funiculus sociatus GB2-A5 TaxID=2933946 RepID=A0ABV0JPW0_9CYAN